MRQAAAQDVEHGCEQQPESRYPQHARKDGNSQGLAHLGARAHGDDQGHYAEDKGQGRHQDGPQAQARGIDGGVEAAVAGRLILAGEFHDENRVFRRQADQHDQSHLYQHIVIEAGEPDAEHGGQDAHGHDEHDGQGQHPAFILGCEHQEHKQYGEGKNAHADVAGGLLLVRQIGPFKAQAIGYPLGSQGFHCHQRVSGSRTGRGTAENGHGRVEVVPLHPIRCGAVIGAGEGTQGDRFSLPIARAQAEQVAGGAAEIGVCLGSYLEGPAQEIEIVDEGGTEVDLQRLEYVLHRNAELFRAHPVDVEVELRSAGLKQGEYPRQSRCLVCSLRYIGRRRRQQVQAAAAAVLEHHAKAAGISQAAHRWWIDHQHRRVVDSRHAGAQLRQQFIEGNPLCLAFFIGREGGKEGCHVGSA